MKASSFSIFIPIIFLFILSCSKGKYDHIFGKEYRSLTEFPEFADMARGGGALIGKKENVNYVINYYRKDTVNLIAFEEISRKVKGQSRFKLLDVLEIYNLEENQQITFGECRMKQNTDKEIIAIYEDVDTTEVQFYKNIVQAWRANQTTRKIEPIEIADIDCVNKVFGL